mgnify:CR=1 FL=1
MRLPGTGPLGVIPGRLACASLLLVLWGPGSAAGQVAPPPGPDTSERGQDARAYAPDAFLDPTAARIFASAQANWYGIDTSVVRYRAVIKQRIAAGIRTPLKDRTIYRNESAVRAFWDRDHDAIIQVLGARSQHPGREQARADENWDFFNDLTIDQPFDPGGDRLLFALGGDDPEENITDPDREDFWFAHPLAQGADTLYRYESGDTLTLSLPDGRRLLTVQLDVLPREADVHRISGTLWIEPEEGALVRAVYRLSRELNVVRDIPDVREEDEAGEFDMVPGLFKPWTFEMSLVAIDYSLWEFEVWLPRSMRVEGEAAAGVLEFPFSMDLSYQIESVTTTDEVAQAPSPNVEERHFESREEAMAFLATLLTDEDGNRYEGIGDTPSRGRRVTRYLVPVDRDILETSSHLPPPIWEDAPGFASEEDLKDVVESLADLPPVPIRGVPWEASWGWARHDLLRYNRVEGPAVGGQFQAETGSPVGPLDFRAKGFFGFADLEPKARLTLERASVKRRLTLGAYRELRPVDPAGRHLELGNSLNALLFGRDDGEYFLATGADLVWRPPEVARDSWSLRFWAERQDDVSNNTDFALLRAFDGSGTFRPNLDALRVEEAGAELHLKPWWGTDPLRPQAGVELYGQGGAWRQVDSTGTGEYARTSAVARLALPLSDGGWRVGMEAGGGTTWGDAPVQRSWFLGGPTTLRGYPASVMAGSSFLRGRLETAWVHSSTLTLTLFGDAGWAGSRDAFDAGDLLYGVGVGSSLLDGLVRFDLSHGLRGPDKGFRVDLYLDAIL